MALNETAADDSEESKVERVKLVARSQARVCPSPSVGFRALVISPPRQPL